MQLPVAGLQLSVVQGLSSLQSSRVPPQLPAEHLSPVVQGWLSLQLPLLFSFTHEPVASLQLSSVQGLSSSHATVSPRQSPPPSQLSFMVQRFPSLHGVFPGESTTSQLPVKELQKSSVQALSSSQLTVAPPHAPEPLHESALVHALPSLQGAPDAAFDISQSPVWALHESIVHGLLSSHSTAKPTHTVFTQMSGVVHLFSSSHSLPELK